MKAFIAVLSAIMMINEAHIDNCSPSEEICEYWFAVEEKLTMQWRGTRVKASNGILYPYFESDINITTKVDSIFYTFGLPGEKSSQKLVEEKY